MQSEGVVCRRKESCDGIGITKAALNSTGGSCVTVIFGRRSNCKCRTGKVVIESESDNCDRLVESHRDDGVAVGVESSGLINWSDKRCGYLRGPRDQRNR